MRKRQVLAWTRNTGEGGQTSQKLRRILNGNVLDSVCCVVRELHILPKLGKADLSNLKESEL